MSGIGIEDYLNLSLRARVAIVVAVAIAVVVAAYLLSYAPKIRKIDSTLERIEQLQEEIDHAVASARNFIPPTEGERDAWKRAEAEVKQLAPRGEDFLPLLYRISLLTENRAGFNLSYPSDGKGGPTTRKKVVRRPVGKTTNREIEGRRTKFFLVRLSLVTEYGKLPDLLEKIHKIDRLVEIESLKVSSQQERVLVNLVLRAYYIG